MRGAGLATSDPICKCWVVNFKCNVYENQAEPCILLRIYFFFLTCEMLERGFPIHPFQHCMEAEFSNNFFQVGSPFVVPSTEPWSFEILRFCGF